ncbi:MAG TPA: hypothetical protein VGW78_03155 [Candidatus Babeliales bacterium]|jgi:hypothetical protein|nr:hypothetical protein [Candidatus Babeliales bacterium]
MKKLILIIAVLLIKTTHCMYDQAGKLKYSEVKLINESPITLELVWEEVRRPEGRRQTITREIKPGATIIVKIGEIGGYFQGSPARIVYKPVPGNETYKQEFPIDLPNSPAFVLTAVKLADIMNNIWVPGVLKADDKGKYSSFEYMTTSGQQWQNTLYQAGKVQVNNK